MYIAQIVHLRFCLLVLAPLFSLQALLLLELSLFFCRHRSEFSLPPRSFWILLGRAAVRHIFEFVKEGTVEGIRFSNIWYRLFRNYDCQWHYTLCDSTILISKKLSLNWIAIDDNFPAMQIYSSCLKFPLSPQCMKRYLAIRNLLCFNA